MNLIQQLEAEAIENLGKDIPTFRAGDTVRFIPWAELL